MKTSNVFWPTRNIDLTLAYSIMETFANLNKGSLPLSEANSWDGIMEHPAELPIWMHALVAALKKIHGEAYYAFALENVTNELLDSWIASGMAAETAESFKAAVRRCMQSQANTLYH